MKGFKIALIQLRIGPDKEENISTAKRLICAAADQGAFMICLPECFNSPYGTQYFAKYAEPIPGPSTNVLLSLAKQYKVFIIGGSIPEQDGDKIFNTCAVFSPSGEMVAKFRKVQLVNIYVPGKLRNCEADVLSPGNSLATFETPYCKVGLGICNDIRFPEITRFYKQQGCKLIVYPSCFNLTTGPVHWELLIKSGALNNQVYVAGINPARMEGSDTFGNSMVANPWGEDIAKCQHQEEILFANIDLDYLDQIRSQLPMDALRRTDLYDLLDKTTPVTSTH